MIPTLISYRLEIPVPDESGWLSQFWPESRVDRLSRAEDWRIAAKTSLALAGFLPQGRVRARVECRPEWIAETKELGFHQPWDLSPSWFVVRNVLRESGIEVFREELVFGPTTPDPLIVVTFSGEVA